MPERIDGLDIIPVEEYFGGKDDTQKGAQPTLPEPPQFSLEALPKPIADLAQAGAKSICCPVDYLACGALGIVAGAIGSSRVARIKSSWSEPSVLYIGLCGPSGDGKSPASQEVSLPVYSRQDRLFSEFKRELKDYEQAVREYKVEEKKARQEERAADAPPDKPFLDSVFIQDTTYEALVQTLYNNKRGLIRLEDELGGMVRSFDQYKGGMGRERSLWLSIWSATAVKVDRKTDEGATYIPHPCVSLVGNIQPKLLPEMLPLDEDHEGFAARILFTYPQPVRIRWTDDEISLEVRSNYDSLIKGLYKLEHGIDAQTFDEDKAIPIEVPFTKEAKARFAEYVNDTADEAAEPGFDDRLSYAWSKFRGYGARVALVLAMCRAIQNEAEERIELEDVESAIKIMDYFKGMGRRVYASMYAGRPIDQLAADVVALLKTLPDHRWYGRPEAGFKLIREASDHAPAAASELCKKLEKISATHPVLRFEHGFEPNKEKLRYWLLELADNNDGGTTPPDRGNYTEKPVENGVRGVRQNHATPMSESATPMSDLEDASPNGEVIHFPASAIEASTTVIKKVEEEAPQEECEHEDFTLVDTPDTLRECIKLIASSELLGVDSETKGLFHKTSRKRLLQITDESDNSFVVDLFKFDDESLKPLMGELENHILVFHNALFDMLVLRQLGMNWPKGVRCTMLMHKTLSNGSGEPGSLSYLAKRIVGYDKVEDYEEGKFDFLADPLPAGAYDYAVRDTKALIPLYNELRRRLTKARNLTYTYDLEMATLKPTVLMAESGLPVDADGLKVYADELECERVALLEEMDGFASEELLERFKKSNKANRKIPEERNDKVNWQSNQQVGWAFATLGVILDTTDKGAPRTDKEYMPTVDHPLAPLVMRLNELKGEPTKWRNAIENRMFDSRLFADWRQWGARTGRYSCGEPPLQGLPNKGTARESIKASEGYRLISSDLSQIEIRVWAALSRDEKLIADINQGGDLYRKFAERAFGREVTKEERDAVKACVLGRNYGMGENTMRHRLAKILKEPNLKPKRVRKLIESIVDAYPIAEQWRQDQMTGDSRKTETRTLAGRLVRNVTEDPQRLNYPIQGSAADVMKEIAVAVVEKIVDVYDGVRLCALIHDETVLLAPEGVADEVAGVLNDLMKSVAHTYLNNGVGDPALCVAVDADTNVVVNLKEKKG